MVDRLWPNALAALAWIDTYGDRDGDGFVEYERRSERGLLNQGWKDSGDAIRDRTGREAVPPIALAEVQGYVFDAKRRMARLARDARRRSAGARGSMPRRRSSPTRFERRSGWRTAGSTRWRSTRTSARPTPSAATPGSACGRASSPPERAGDVVERLLRPSMFSGWGVRTFAADQPGYNPIGYHTGTVWPHDTSLIAAGFKRYGFDEATNRLAGQMMEAAQGFPDYRLPELFCGFDRTDAHTPVPYPVACSPQAWAAGSSFLFLETMLGLRAHADRGRARAAAPAPARLAWQGDAH